MKWHIYGVQYEWQHKTYTPTTKRHFMRLLDSKEYVYQGHLIKDSKLKSGNVLKTETYFYLAKDKKSTIFETYAYTEK